MERPNAIAAVITGTVRSMPASCGRPKAETKWPSWKTQTTMPSAAPTLSTFVRTALNGSSTEPVKANSSRNVTSITAPAAIGARSASASR